MNKVYNISKENSILLKKIESYKKEEYSCKEGYITSEGVVTGTNGKKININESINNMKGKHFDKNLIKYDIDYCITSAKNNIDKYIIHSNNKNNISFVIKINDGKYINEIIDIFNSNNSTINLLVNINSINYITNNNVIGYFNNKKEYNEFKKKVDNYYCGKYNNYDILNECSKDNKNTILVNNIIYKDLLKYIKNNNDNNIIFIDENKYIYEEINVSIKYLKSKNIDIISLDNLFN